MGSAASWEHWDTGSIPGPAQWVENPVLLQLWPDESPNLDRSRGRGPPYTTGGGEKNGEGKKKKKKKKKKVSFEDFESFLVFSSLENTSHLQK